MESQTLPSTGHAAVDGVLRPLADLDTLPVSEHVAVLTDAVAGLRTALDTALDTAPDTVVDTATGTRSGTAADVSAGVTSGASSGSAPGAGPARPA